MPIAKCGSCGAKLKVSEKLIGTRITCPKCKTSTVLACDEVSHAPVAADPETAPIPTPPSFPAPPPFPEIPSKALKESQILARQLVHDGLQGAIILREMVGNNRHISVTEHEVVVGSVGISSGSWFGKRVKRYPIGSITSIDVRKSLLIVELQIIMGGANEIASSAAGFFARAENENITGFPKSQYDEVQRFAAFILDLQRRLRSGQVDAAQPAEALPSIADQIRQLAELKNAGILTQAEFDAKKTELLSRL